MIAGFKTGVARGGIELRQTFTTASDLWGYFFPTVLLLATIFFMRDAKVPGTAFSLGASTLPSALGMGLAFGPVLGAMILIPLSNILRAQFSAISGLHGFLYGLIMLLVVLARPDGLLGLFENLWAKFTDRDKDNDKDSKKEVQKAC